MLQDDYKNILIMCNGDSNSVNDLKVSNYLDVKWEHKTHTFVYCLLFEKDNPEAMKRCVQELINTKPQGVSLIINDGIDCEYDVDIPVVNINLDKNNKEIFQKQVEDVLSQIYDKSKEIDI